MTFDDKLLHCSDCDTDFTFSTEEQEFFASKGYTNEPKRCPACRQARKSARYANDGYKSGYQRQIFPAICAECNKETEVPFQPRDDRPVYCRECYAKIRLSR